MPKAFRKPVLTFMLLLLGSACLPGLVASVRAGPPKIDHIELYLTAYVLIHFDAPPNFNYVLQYTETLTNGAPGGTWTNLYVADKSVDFQHYAIVDTRTRKQRFYRLVAFP